MADDFKIQVSYKVGPNSQDMINVRAQNGHELQQLLTELSLAGAAVTSAGATLRGIETVTQVFPGAAVQQPAAVPEVPNNVTQLPPPAPIVPGSDQAPRFCAHGPRSRKEGTTNGRKWVAYFCSLPKGSPGACEAEWVR